jgi:hypothetical protein
MVIILKLLIDFAPWGCHLMHVTLEVKISGIEFSIYWTKRRQDLESTGNGWHGWWNGRCQSSGRTRALVQTLKGHVFE